MRKQCKNCGADLPGDASFCPHCTQSQIERREVKAPRLWRKKALIVAFCGMVLVLAALSCVLHHRPKTYEGDASVIYTDKDGEYELLVNFSPDAIASKQPEAQRSITIPYNETYGLFTLLGVYQNGELADTENFFAKVESCTLEAFPNENGGVQTTEVAEDTVFLPAARECNFFFNGTSGTNELIWTLQMKNGDTIRLRHTLEVIPLYHQTYTSEDTPLDTMEDLKALLDRINTEVPANTIVDIYLPAVSYTGDLTIASRAVNLYGCSDGTGRTVFTGSLSVRTDSPANVTLFDLDFSGSGGTGLSATATTLIYDCSFFGWDIGALAEDGGIIGVERCVFQNNGIGLKYDTNDCHFFKGEFFNCRIDGNEIGIQFANLQGGIPMDFTDTLFSGNGIDIDNPIQYPIETSKAIFQ